MKKIIILIPVFNDWESLNKLLKEIDENINEFKNYDFKSIIINDASTNTFEKLVKPKNFEFIKILNMEKNRGHARCNAFGLLHIKNNEKFDYVILMDGDGEDRPVELKSLINKINEHPNNSVVAKRVKRSEGFFFRFLYKVHKLITLLFTGKNINFGNYSCLTNTDVEILSDRASLWSSYSGTLKKNVANLKEVESTRGLRYFGPSKMSLFQLLLHSFSIIAVFRYVVLFRTILLIIFLFFLETYLGPFSHFLNIILAIFTICIFIVSKRENKNELINSEKNLKSIKIIK